MKIIEREVRSRKMLDSLITQARHPTIISISRKHSFGAHWLHRMLGKVKLEYEDRIAIHAFYVEDPAKIMALLGEGKSMITYFVKEQEIKSHLTGSVSKANFDTKLAMIITENKDLF